MAPVHRHSDSRICGATTVVSGQDSVTVNGLLWAVKGDQNTHGAGGLINTTGSSVTIHGINVIVHGADDSNPDLLCPVSGEPHCNPKTAAGSGNVSCY
jgi:uncharacterized Zn-binding protein involved in type VI secretion